MMEQRKSGITYLSSNSESSPAAFAALTAKCNALHDLITSRPVRFDRSMESWGESNTTGTVGRV